MFIVFAWNRFGVRVGVGCGDTSADCWGDLLQHVTEEEIESLEWFQAERVTVTQKTVFSVEN